MSLSYITLVQPLYNIYKAYQDVYDRYGRNVYLNVLFQDTPSMNKAHAPKSVVAGLVNTIVTNINAFYNQKINTFEQLESARSLTGSYVGVAISLVLVISILVVVFLAAVLDLKQFKNQVDFVKVVIVTILINAWTIAGAVLVKQRHTAYNDKVHNVSLDGYLSSPELSETIFKIAPSFVQAEITEKSTHIIMNKKFIKDIYKAASANNLSDVYGLHRLAIYVRAMEDASAPIDDEVRNYAYNTMRSAPLMHVPPFEDPDWHPVLLLRAIQRIDPVGQLNRVGDAVAYLSGFVKKEYNTTTTLTEAVKEEIVERITTIFANTGVVSKEFMMHEAFLSTVQPVENIDSAPQCQIKCMESGNAVMSYFENNKCYLVNDMHLSKPNLVYVQDKEKNPAELFVKPYPKKIKIASSATNLDAMASNTYPVTFDSSSLSINQIGSVGISDGLLKATAGYESIEKPAKYWELFAGGEVVNATETRRRADLLTLETDTIAIVDREMLMKADFLNDNRYNYLEAITKELNRLDPSNTFVLDALTIDRIVNGIMEQSTVVKSNQKGVIVDILNEVMHHRQEVAGRPNHKDTDGSTDDGKKAKYITADEFVSKLSKMEQDEFVYKLFYYVYELTSTSNGLYGLYKYYDSSKEMTEKTVKLIQTSFMFIAVIGVILIVMNIMSDSYYETYPQWQELKSKYGADKTISSQIFDLFVNFLIKWFSVVCILVVVLVILWAYKTRLEKIEQFNRDILDRNGNVIRDSSKKALQSLLDGVMMNQMIPVTDQATFPRHVSIHTYDHFLSSVSINHGKPVSTAGIDAKDIYIRIIDALDAYQKCNAIFLGNNIDIPFPYYEVTLYGTVIVMMLVILLVIFSKMKPSYIFESIKHLNRVKNDLSRNIIPDKLGFSCDEKGTTGPTVDLVLRTVTMAIIPIVTILFATNLLSGANGLASALYGSAMYRNNECYNP